MFLVIAALCMIFAFMAWEHRNERLVLCGIWLLLETRSMPNRRDLGAGCAPEALHPSIVLVGQNLTVKRLLLGLLMSQLNDRTYGSRNSVPNLAMWPDIVLTSSVESPCGSSRV
eukprot:IDg499t1